MYLFYLNDLLLPITPSKIVTKVSGNSKTMDLVNSGEINLVKFPRLTEYSFDIELVHDIKNITYRASEKKPKEVLDFLENAKKNKEVIEFRVIRKMGGTTRFAIDQKVTIESYDIEEDSENNSDVVVKLELKQFRAYRTKHLSQYDKQLSKRPSGNKTNNKKTGSIACLKQLQILTYLNIRSGAGTHNRKVAVFSPGDKPMGYAEFMYNGKVWYKVKHSAGDKGWGWISGDSRYVKVLKVLKKSEFETKSILNDYNSGRSKTKSANPNTR